VTGAVWYVGVETPRPACVVEVMGRVVVGAGRVVVGAGRVVAVVVAGGTVVAVVAGVVVDCVLTVPVPPLEALPEQATSKKAARIRTAAKAPAVPDVVRARESTRVRLVRRCTTWILPS
jgi:hypothetical protein